jgi:hypothetical protein
MNLKGEIELRAMQLEASTERAQYVMRCIHELQVDHLAKRLRRSQRWADTLFWIAMVLLFGNVVLLWALLN